MKTKPMHHLARVPLIMAALTSAAQFAGAQIVTNWVAYNDHRPGPLIPPAVPIRTDWGTSVRTTTLDMGAPGETTGNLINYLTGDALVATVSFARVGAPDDFGTVSNDGPRTNSPAGQIFFGVVDLSNDGIVGVDSTDAASVTITFNNLDPAKRYVFRGTGARGGGYLPRWSVASITADGFIDAHIVGAGSPGILTSNDPSANLVAGQAAWNSGDNVEGDVIGWDFITPAPDGSFSISCAQYLGPVPGGVADSDYAYSFGALLLAEVEVAAPVVTTNPPSLTSVEQNRSFTLRVAAAGTPLLYQWYKVGVGAIPGATFPTYSVSTAALGDSGNYYAVVYNPLASATSTTAQVTVFADTTAPSVATIFSYPTVDSSGVATLDQIIIEFNEPVQPASVNLRLRYTVPGGGNPASVIVTNERTVVLVLASPLAEDTAYSVTASGMMDAVGNTAGPTQASFRSWVSGPGNGLLFEAFSAGGGVEVDTLVSNPNYPDNAFLRATLRIFDSRAIFPDDTQEQYGARIRGVFIPPVSGNWVFFFRTFDRGIVYLNPNGTDAAGKQEILRESTGNNPRNWDKFTSSAFPLQAGQGYYIEALYKADAGADVIKVAARLSGTGFPLPVDAPNTDVDSNAIAGAAIAFPLAPRDLGGALTFVQDLQNLTAEANHLATFAPQVSNPSGLPVFYQWFRDGVEIPGANGPTYSLQVTSADSSATFRVQVAKIGALTNSRTATLTVVPDTNGPVLLSVKGDDSFSKVLLTWNEAISPEAAQEEGSYKILAPNMTEIPVFDATLVNGSNVVLILATRLQPNTAYSFEAAFQTDIIGLPTIKVGNPTVDSMHGVVTTLRSFVITPGLARFQAYLGLSSAGTLDGFITSQVYPDGSTFSFHTNVLNWPQSAPNIEQYAMRFTGLFVASESGVHLFDPAHDDDARLRIYANDDPSSTFTEVLEPGVSAFGAGLTADVTLVAGQRYFYELIVREFAGGDYAGMAVTLPSGAVSSPIAAQYLEAATDPGSGTPGAPQIAVRRSAGNLVITWPGSVTGFTLETAPTIPSATWAPVSSTVVNGENTATIPIPASGNAFYRLRQ